ncbi:unnamed protein product [Coregonus sp. 'balchen']|nr:unnamed protein product [Coregonus sp. 'balchen']
MLFCFECIIKLLLYTHSSIYFTAQNLALRGKATQSDLIENPWHGFSHASNAIDGNRDSHFHHGSCTATDESTNPWWRVDLLDTYMVTSVTITNRGDAVPERLNGAEIRIGNSLVDNAIHNPLAKTIASVPAGSSLTLDLNPAFEGRYASKDFLHSVKWRNECGDDRKATQSSLHGFGFANNAIDGNRNVFMKMVPAPTPKPTITPGGMVDLLKTYKVFSITITNTVDSVPSRLMELRFALETPWKTTASTIPGGNSSTFQCNGMEGRYVNVVIPGRKEYLTLCEVEVYGAGVIQSIPAGRSLTLRWTSGVEGRYVTVVLPGKNKILTLCEVEVYGYHSSTGENVSLKGKATQSSLHKFGSACAVISSIPAGFSSTFQCNGMEGRYVNVVIPDRREYLILCEVEVYGAQLV